jgi:hypothetical protein
MKRLSAPILIALVFSFAPNVFSAQNASTHSHDAAQGDRENQVRNRATARAQPEPARTTETDKKSPRQQPVVARDNSSNRLSPNKIHQRIEEAERS